MHLSQYIFFTDLVAVEEVLEILEVRVEVDEVDDEPDGDAEEEDPEHRELLLRELLVLHVLLSLDRHVSLQPERERRSWHHENEDEKEQDDDISPFSR